MKKIKKRNNSVKNTIFKRNFQFIIIVLLIVIGTLFTGYALFNKALNVYGTAITTGTFNVEFYSSTVSNNNGCSAVSAISSDKNVLSVNIPDLTYPGASATIDITVKNIGNVKAELESVNLFGNNDSDIIITYPTFEIGKVLNPNDLYTFSMVITWDSNSKATYKSVDFATSLNYKQSV